MMMVVVSSSLPHPPKSYARLLYPQLKRYSRNADDEDYLEAACPDSLHDDDDDDDDVVMVALFHHASCCWSR